jgi:type I restriction enzyme, S subunit
MNGALEQRIYKPAEVIAFRKTNEPFGGLSNMAPGFPVVVNHVRFWTSEALYQCCRYPDAPDVQRLIASQRSPMTAKMKSKKYRDRTRPDWENIRVRVMRWSLRVKLAQNQNTFGQLLLATGDKPIVEESTKDQFWGAKVQNGDALAGVNVLGRLLMELREQLRTAPPDFEQVQPPQIQNFLLFGQAVGAVSAKPEPGTLINYPERAEEEQPKVRISGAVSKTDWDNLIKILAASRLSPEKAFLNIELQFSPESGDDPQIKMLAEAARRFGIRFKLS